MLGISAALLSAANAFAPLLGGLLFQIFGPPAPFMLGGILMGFLAVVAILTIKPDREETLPAGLARSAEGN
jgi:predicted MFS family arabinose efflux permease